MHTIYGGDNSAWKLSLDYNAVERVRGAVTLPARTSSLGAEQPEQPLDLLTIGDHNLEDPDGPLQRIAENRRVLLQTVHAILDCSFEEFAKAMDGDGIESAEEAFALEIIDFLPRASRAARLKAFEFQKAFMETIQTRLLDVHRKSIQLIEGPQMEEFLSEVEALFVQRFGLVPVSSASTRDPSPTANSST